MKTRHLMLWLALLSPAGAAHAIPLTVYEFELFCEDCSANTDPYEAQWVSFRLELKNYTEGDAFAASNFHSFSYGGSNLVNPFTVDRSDWSTGQGSLIAGNHESFELLVTKDGKGRKAPDPLWTCTELGAAVAVGDACAATSTMYFALNLNGSNLWQFGDPAKDHGPTSAPGNHVPEPSSVLLAGLAVAATRRFRL